MVLYEDRVVTIVPWGATVFDLGVSPAYPPRGPAREEIPRKEVIQPHLPVRLPCYDFTPVTRLTLGVGLVRLQVPRAPMV